MHPFEIREGDLLISDNRTLLDRALVHTFLSEHSYWASGVPREIVERSIENSLCFGAYQAGRQLAFARVVTDYATFAWLADVFVLEAARGQGLGKRLITAVLAHPRLQGLRRFSLATRDAHGLYAQLGFAPLAEAGLFMEICRPNAYQPNQKP